MVRNSHHPQRLLVEFVVVPTRPPHQKIICYSVNAHVNFTGLKCCIDNLEQLAIALRVADLTPNTEGLSIVEAPPEGCRLRQRQSFSMICRASPPQSGCLLQARGRCEKVVRCRVSPRRLTWGSRCIRSKLNVDRRLFVRKCHCGRPAKQAMIRALHQMIMKKIEDLTSPGASVSAGLIAVEIWR